jgi:hypothetical protein
MVLYEKKTRQKLNAPSKLSGFGLRMYAPNPRPRRWAMAAAAKITAMRSARPIGRAKRRISVF